MERDNLEDFDVCGKIVFKWLGEGWSKLIWLRIGTGDEGPSELHNDPSGPIKCGEFIQ